MTQHVPIYIMTKCNFFREGLSYLTGGFTKQLTFIRDIDEIVINYSHSLNIVIVLDVSSLDSLQNFKSTIDFLAGINCKKRIGVVVSRLNSYLTYYISKKLSGKVTFFNSHNLKNGIFLKNFRSWLKGRTFRPMRTVTNYRDIRYGFTLREWLSLVVPLSGESICEMSLCLGLSNHILYQARAKALKKLDFQSYHEFCHSFINKTFIIENDDCKEAKTRIRHRSVNTNRG